MTKLLRELKEVEKCVSEATSIAHNLSARHIIEKSKLDYVTDVDLRLQEHLIDALEKLFPGVPIVSEESIKKTDCLPDTAIIIDPLDGTHNFISNLDHCAISVAFIEKSTTIFGVISDIYQENIYSAHRDSGAFKNDDRIELNKIASGLFATSSGFLDAALKRQNLFPKLRKFGKHRNLGAQSLHLCYQAEGRFCFAASVEAKIWDDAAARLLVRETNQNYYSFSCSDGQVKIDKDQNSLAVHPSIADKVLSVIRQIPEMSKLTLQG